MVEVYRDAIYDLLADGGSSNNDSKSPSAKACTVKMHQRKQTGENVVVLENASFRACHSATDVMDTVSSRSTLSSSLAHLFLL